METITSMFNRINRFFTGSNNLEFVGTYHHHPQTPVPNLNNIRAHQVTLEKAFDKYLTDAEIKHITQALRRSQTTQDAILADFFSGDVEPHDIPWDQHTEIGLQAMLDAFRPPQKCLPAHLNDVEHHYPYKWQVNAEPPFVSDDYFLDNRKTFGDFWNPVTKQWTGYVNPLDMTRRHGTEPSDMLLSQVTPPKFGFMKGMIFSWTRRWHHIIKKGFSDTTGLENTSYFQRRFIFPMLLHTKTAIVKKDDPDKMRTIWGCSKPWIIADTMLYWEYIAWLKLNPGSSPMLWGYETFTGGWLRLNARSSFITIDWKRFDKKAYFSLIHRIMQGTRQYLDFSRGYIPNFVYHEHKDWNQSKELGLHRLWEWTLENLFNAPIVLPDGKMYKRNYAGIPSGLFITQILDSWYNYTMLATLLSALGYNPRESIIKVQGDDSIIRLGLLLPPNTHDEFLTKMQNLADHYFKAVISLDKSNVRDTLNGCEVLSYTNNHGWPRRNEIEMLAQFYHTKANNPTPEITMAQAIGFAYAACGNHDRVHTVCKDIYEYYHRQGFTPNPAGFTLVFGDSPDRPETPFKLDHFPSVAETQRYLTYTEYRNKEQDLRTWPTSYFAYLPCARP
uniref:RNA-dependent RNA polymerase n=1 Tax=Rosellinia necatrix partitivirus 9 TaxID=2056550 RepID=A0A2Z5WAG1_9VIRU|nr:RNA-dependent RNA polymerase [Rosellinia necatrix partitivirus 9]